MLHTISRAVRCPGSKRMLPGGGGGGAGGGGQGVYECGKGVRALKTIRGALSTRASQNVSMAAPVHISFLWSWVHDDYVVLQCNAGSM